MNNMSAVDSITATVGKTKFDVYTYVPEIRKSERIVDPLIHMHHNEEFFYIYGGSVTLVIADGKKSVTLKPGDLCMIPSEMYHCAFSESAERLCFEARIFADRSTGDPTAKYYSDVLRSLRALDMPIVINAPYIDVSMERYRRLSNQGSNAFGAGGMTTLLGVVLYALENVRTSANITDAAKPSDIREDERKAIIERFISEYFGTTSCLEMLSKALCLSERRTSSVVREVMHKSFKELIVEERMRVADMLIKSGKYSLEEVAVTVGYSSYSGFYTAWVRYYGHSPAEHSTR